MTETPMDFGTTLTAHAVKTASGPATNALIKWGQRKYDKFIATYTNALSEYVNTSIQQCRTVKNILYRNQLASTDEKYVNVKFESSKNENISDSSLISALTNQRHIIIRGRGGAGKTMFTKWAVLRIADSTQHHQKIPIYIELRDLYISDGPTKMEEIIFSKISTNRNKTNFGQFMEGLKAGIFIFVLDAADEINKTYRNIALKKIKDFGYTYPETSILVTSRDFDEIDGLEGFERYRTGPLSQKQSIEIIDKLDYDLDTKEALKKDLSTPKYQKHNFFLENPLLVTILLLTYDQSKDIPTKRSSFYKRAFEALYERHDGAKGIYRRDHHAGLPMDEFEKVFSTFCFGTYLNSAYDFSESQLVAFFREATRQTGIDEDPSLIAKDASESVCLLIKEGHEYVFAHRSFQEYFSALFIKNYKDSDISDLLNAALSRASGENVLEFLYEMDQEILEKKYILPKLGSLVKKISKYNENEDYILLMNFFIKEITITKDGSFNSLRFGDDLDSRILTQIQPLYPETNIFRLFSEPHGDITKFFDNLPFDKIVTSRTQSVIKPKSSQVEYKLKFTPSCSSWINFTPFPDRIKEVVRDIRSLHQRLSDKYSLEKSAISVRFSKFSTDD